MEGYFSIFMNLPKNPLIVAAVLTLAACSSQQERQDPPADLHIVPGPPSGAEMHIICAITRGEAFQWNDGDLIECPDPNAPSPISPPAIQGSVQWVRQTLQPGLLKKTPTNVIQGLDITLLLQRSALKNLAREGQTPTNVIPGLDITPLLQRSAPENPAREGQAPIATIPGLDITKLPEVQQLLGQSAPKPSSGHLNQFPPGPNDV